MTILLPSESTFFLASVTVDWHFLAESPHLITDPLGTELFLLLCGTSL